MGLYRLICRGVLVAKERDFLSALPRSRALAQEYDATVEVRDSQNIVLAVSVTGRGKDNALSRAARHNLDVYNAQRKKDERAAR